MGEKKEWNGFFFCLHKKSLSFSGSLLPPPVGIARWGVAEWWCALDGGCSTERERGRALSRLRERGPLSGLSSLMRSRKKKVKKTLDRLFGPATTKRRRETKS